MLNDPTFPWDLFSERRIRVLLLPQSPRRVRGWLQLTHRGLEVDSPRWGLEEGQGLQGENHVTSTGQGKGATGTCEK